MTPTKAYAEALLANLLGRRSVSPKRLAHPGPSLADIDLMLQAALRAPDHGGLHPWRVIEFRAEQRSALADCFEQEKLRRDPLASEFDLRRARDHALGPPVLLAFVVSTRTRSKVPLREQLLSCGAALGNLLNAAHQLGYGAIMLSGERCFDAELVRQIGTATGEQLAGFVTIGTIAEAPPVAKPVLPEQVWSCWMPGGDQVSSTGSTDMPAITEPATEHLFSYGTLQSQAVQLATFGRKLDGRADLLQGFKLDRIEISDASVVKTGGKTHHPIICHTGVSDDGVAGIVFTVTPSELAQADAYEVSDYRRNRVLLASGVSAWSYVDARVPASPK